jgi:hypothetical protein
MHQLRDLRIEEVMQSKGMTESEAFKHLFATMMRLSPETPQAYQSDIHKADLLLNLIQSRHWIADIRAQHLEQPLDLETLRRNIEACITVAKEMSSAQAIAPTGMPSEVFLTLFQQYALPRTSGGGGHGSNSNAGHSRVQQFDQRPCHGNTGGQQHNHSSTGRSDGLPSPRHVHQQQQVGQDAGDGGQLVVGPSGMNREHPAFGTRGHLPTCNANAETKRFGPGALRNGKRPTLCRRCGEEGRIRRYCQSSEPRRSVLDIAKSTVSSWGDTTQAGNCVCALFEEDMAVEEEYKCANTTLETLFIGYVNDHDPA